MSDLHIPFARYRFHCRALEELNFPRYAGSAWRGAFGHALRRAVCVTRQAHCHGCLLQGSCAYREIFETPPPANAPLLHNYPAAPHPFIIHPEATHGSRYQTGDSFTVDLTLVGRANAQLSYLIHTWHQIGNLGIGTGRGKFEVTAVSQYHDSGWRTIYRPGEALEAQPPSQPPLPPLPSGQCRLWFQTPVRIRHRGRLMGPRSFRFRGLIANLLRRLSLFQHLHGPTPLHADFRALTERAEAVLPVAQTLRWFDWKRFSSRQQTEMDMGGLLGQVTFAAADLEPFWPYLALGQWLHVGKSTVMGLGRYRLEAE